MKKLLGVLVLGLLLTSCSEEKKQSKEIKEENKYLKSSMTKKLGDIDKIYMKEIVDKQIKGEIDGLPMLMMFYMGTGVQMIYCDAMAEISLETDSKKKDEMYKDLYLKQSEEECKIYREIYEKYNSMYQKIIDTNSIPVYFYFELGEGGEGDSASKSDVGIFPTKKECEYYSNLFREKDIGLTSNCKKGFTPS